MDCFIAAQRPASGPAGAARSGALHAFGGRRCAPALVALFVLASTLAACKEPTPPATGAEERPAVRGEAGASADPVIEAADAGAREAAPPAVLAQLPRLEASEAERQSLQALYQPEGGRAWWIDTRGRPNERADEALAALQTADREGLVPEDYAAGELRRLAQSLREGQASGDAAHLFELRLSQMMMRYLKHVQMGRVEPRSLGFKLHAGSPGMDHAAQLRNLLSGASGRSWQASLEGLRPTLPQYEALREALAHYRELAGREHEAPPVPAQPRVRPGEPYAGVEALGRRLALLGDLDPSATPAAASTTSAVSASVPAGSGPAPVLRYEGALVDAVRRFQSRHGLEPDGVLGKGTFAALNVPLAERVRQIELAMERLRWVPRLADQPFVAVNIPMFRLWAAQPDQGDTPPLGMRVIVGRALDTETPVMFDQMRYLVFSPYWNVPRSIVRDEILPALQREPGYLDRQQMELVRGERDDSPVVAATPEHIEALRRGQLRVRQRPGPHNSLGLVKFIFPNDASIYLHGTPAQSLFGRDRRDMSHGCVRVEDPVALAQWLLRDRPEWTRERIVEAMNAGRPTQVDLTRPVPVLLFYVTAMVLPDGQGVHFASDIYGHDAKLAQALARRRGTS